VFVYIFLYIYIVHSTALNVEQSILGRKAGFGQSYSGEKLRHCAGNVTDMGTGRDVVG
jgi:hypothetical protein